MPYNNQQLKIFRLCKLMVENSIVGEIYVKKIKAFLRTGEISLVILGGLSDIQSLIYRHLYLLCCVAV